MFNAKPVSDVVKWSLIRPLSKSFIKLANRLAGKFVQSNKYGEAKIEVHTHQN